MTSPLLHTLARFTLSSRLSPRLEITRLHVRVPQLPVDLDGFTIAHISDLHVGIGDWEPPWMEEVASALTAERADIVVNTGDYLQGVPPAAKALAHAERLLLPESEALQGPRNLAVLGNHDYYAGEEAVHGLRAGLEALGVRVLANEMLSISRGGSPVVVAGLDGQAPGFDETSTLLREASAPRIVLMHEAELAERLARGTADLVLAGHTHGGQIALPGLTPLIVRRFNGSKFIAGWYHVNGNRLYINRGLGCTGLPLRFRARPEVTFFRLRR